MGARGLEGDRAIEASRGLEALAVVAHAQPCFGVRRGRVDLDATALGHGIGGVDEKGEEDLPELRCRGDDPKRPGAAQQPKPRGLVRSSRGGDLNALGEERDGINRRRTAPRPDHGHETLHDLATAQRLSAHHRERLADLGPARLVERTLRHRPQRQLGQSEHRVERVAELVRDLRRQQSDAGDPLASQKFAVLLLDLPVQPLAELVDPADDVAEVARSGRPFALRACGDCPMQLAESRHDRSIRPDRDRDGEDDGRGGADADELKRREREPVRIGSRIDDRVVGDALQRSDRSGHALSDLQPVRGRRRAVERWQFAEQAERGDGFAKLVALMLSPGVRSRLELEVGEQTLLRVGEVASCGVVRADLHQPTATSRRDVMSTSASTSEYSSAMPATLASMRSSPRHAIAATPIGSGTSSSVRRRRIARMLMGRVVAERLEGIAHGRPTVAFGGSEPAVFAGAPT